MSVAPQTALGKLLAFLEELERKHIAYTIAHVRETIMVCIAVPSQRWEVEFFEDGEIEIERFVSTGNVDGIEYDELVRLINNDEN